ncbi:MAG: winged helix-turn-helix transcriptional regulator [Candidatus Diapherotrites archaeon]|uniref:Winged helix-turn-helix transcriptional regulator n=1 Tax=Candidatus Iainarchaeum sp. TaxID=3101447 RepID=A0A938YXA3_9ARCH|nr:winged helix-turn-helix transcriptional regulator [Candidatus Diapherotrites archaeon]
MKRHFYSTTGTPLFQNHFKTQKQELSDKDMKSLKSEYLYPAIHWWQFPLDRFSIELDSKYKKTLFERIYEERRKSNRFSKFLNEKSKIYGKNWTFKKQRFLLYEYKKHQKFVPAWVIFCTATYLGVELLEIEKKIESYISFRGRLVVSEPKLPVRVTPEFTAIAIHTMCDGCNHLGSITYFQRDKKEQLRFSKLAANVFGTYRVKDNKYSEILPKVFGEVISSYYKITDYSTFGARIPDKIKNSPFQHRLAALVAFILDEGTVSLGITLHSSNKLLLLDICEIAKSLGYLCRKIQQRKMQKTLNPFFRFRISPKSIGKLYTDLMMLYERFPNLNFNKKMHRIQKIWNTQTRNWKQRRKGETRQLIINELKKSKKTTFELSESTGICLKTVYHHLKRISNLSKIREGTQIYYEVLD